MVELVDRLAADPGAVPVVVLMLAAGVLLYAGPSWPLRPIGLVGLGLAGAIASWRQLGPGVGVAVSAVAIAAALLLAGRGEALRERDPIGFR